MNTQQKDQMIKDATALCLAASVEPELDTVSAHLQSVNHPYAKNFYFVFCVACDIGRVKRTQEATA